MRTLSALLLVLAGTAAAYADDPPPYVAPFLMKNELSVYTIKGAFGPAKDTTIVATIAMKDPKTLGGFALVPDARAKDGYRKLPLPRLVSGSADGSTATALVANLDKDAADELVLACRVLRAASDGKGNGFGYSTYEYVVLDWDGKQFVHLPALEKKLAAKMKSRSEGPTDALTEADVRSALGLPTK